MKYYIAYLLTGEAKKEHDCLTDGIAKKFGIFHKSPAHVTLKRPFKTGNIEEIEKLLLSFSKIHQKPSLELKGFGMFDKDVIFVDVRSSPKADRLIKELDIKLRKVPWLGFDKFDKKRNLHATVAFKGDTKEKFDAIWAYVSKQKFEFDVWLDNISILQKKNAKWIVYKRYTLK